MRIVLFNDKKAERDAMMRTFANAGYHAEGSGDEQAALAAISRESPQIIVFSAPSKGAADLVRRLKGADSSGQAYLLSLVESTPSASDLAHIIEAGANDFLRRPVVDVELLERLKAPARLVKWVKSLTTTSAFDLVTRIDVAELHAWRSLGDLVAVDLSAMAGHPFCVSKAWPKRFTHHVRSATIPMSLAGDELEARVSVVVDAITIRWVKSALLGNPNASVDAVDDALRELANTAGGAVKRAALTENVVLTTGIPSTDNASSHFEQHSCWTLAPEGSDCFVAVVGEIRQRANQRVAASQLTEGMVLAHDVRNESGILLVPAGSRLTSTSAIKLSALLGPRFFLEVAPTA